MIDRELEEFLVNRHIAATCLSKTKKLMLQRAWRKVFAVSTYEKTGKWRYRGHDWHSFSYDFYPHLDGNRALQKYVNIKGGVFYVIPDDKNLMGYECRGKKLPDLSSFGQDIYVVPAELGWTMVFTHEQPEFGPYYAKRITDRNIVRDAVAAE